MKVVLAALAAALFLALLATPATAVTRSGARASGISVRGSQFGRILFDHRGFVLYGFTRDRARRSVCYGACAAAWPPYLVKARPRALAGARSRLIGTTRRRDGKLQATYAGRPLYYYVGDRRRGQILCQNVVEYGGTWLVLRANGRYVR
jgi:predicted lipoprotein with Yx(FWY)xxD motif